MTRPLRRMTLHLSQIFFTLGLTFMTLPLSCAYLFLLVSVNDPTSGEVVRTQLHDYTIFRKDANVVLSHLSADVREDFMPVREFNSKHCIWQSFSHGALDLNGTIFFRQALPTPMFFCVNPRPASLGQGGRFLEIGLLPPLQKSGNDPKRREPSHPGVQSR